MYRLSLLLLSLTGCSEYSSKSDAEMMDTGSNLMAETEIQRLRSEEEGALQRIIMLDNQLQGANETIQQTSWLMRL